MKTRALIAMAAVALAACGGGGGQDEPPVADDGRSVPASVASSTTTWLQYAGALPESDTAEPKTLEKVDMAPTSEADEPLDLF